MSKTDLTRGQHWLLEHLQYGERIAYSQDGDSAWLHSSQIWIGPSDVSVEEFTDLRQRRLIGAEPHDPDELYRHGPCEVITDAGRELLSHLKEEGR
jgi:hypothetical protein